MATVPTPLPDIGLLGRKRHGKDTAAAALCRFGYHRASFADTVRAVALAADPIVEVWTTLEAAPIGTGCGVATQRLSDVVAEVGWERAKDLLEVRRFLQALGTEGVRDHLGEDTWVRAAMERATHPAVFSDVRFPNEARAVKDGGGYLVRIVRPGLPDDGDLHASETALDGWPVDFVIHNAGSVEDLHDAMEAVLEAVLAQ